MLIIYLNLLDQLMYCSFEPFYGTGSLNYVFVETYKDDPYWQAFKLGYLVQVTMPNRTDAVGPPEKL